MIENEPPRSVVYLIACAAPPMLSLDTAVKEALLHELDPHIVLTPSAARWADIPSLIEMSGHVVRVDYKLPGEPDVWPPADAIVLAPATFNTVNKVAAGITDNLALGIVAEAIGKRIPIVCLPFVNQPLSEHFAFSRSLTHLRESGVDVLFGADLVSPTEPDTGFSMVDAFPWQAAFGRIRDKLQQSG